MDRVPHSFDDQFDFGFRPDTYWPRTPTENSVLSSIAGTARRDIARRALDEEEPARPRDLDIYRDTIEFVLQAHLDESDRERWGRIHPELLGGEFLPAMQRDEVEIARINLRSITADAISVRAVLGNGDILYRVVDDYSDEGSHYAVSPTESTEPLTFGELVGLIDSARQTDEGRLIGAADYDVGLVESALNGNCDLGGIDPSSLEGFVHVSSTWYPELTRYYELRCAEWAEEKTEQLAETALDDLQEQLARDDALRGRLQAAIESELRGCRISGSLVDDGAPTFRSFALDSIEIEDAIHLGTGEFAISFAIAGEAQISFLVPDSSIEDGTDLDALGLSDFDRWNKFGFEAREFELVVELITTATWEDGHWLATTTSDPTVTSTGTWKT